MNNANETQTTRIAAGLIDKAQRRAGVINDDAFARMLNVDADELADMRRGGVASIREMVGVAAAFGTPLREIVAQRRAEAVAA
ncbi:hypothetical protein [Microbacterium sp.]|uniref:hypothetical protein n=1 Tax=Microbacterium sp. TaxID=51671 RepID=UPI003A900586